MINLGGHNAKTFQRLFRAELLKYGERNKIYLGDKYELWVKGKYKRKGSVRWV